MTLEEQVAELAAKEAIRALPQRYCDCVWRDDIDGLVGLFTEDGSFIAVMPESSMTVSGRDAILGMFQQALGMKPRPYIHNHVIEMKGTDQASGRCYLDLRAGRQNLEIMGAGYYEDEYRRVDGEWFFQSRRYIALRMDELPDGF